MRGVPPPVQLKCRGKPHCGLGVCMTHSLTVHSQFKGDKNLTHLRIDLSLLECKARSNFLYHMYTYAYHIISYAFLHHSLFSMKSW